MCGIRLLFSLASNTFEPLSSVSWHFCPKNLLIRNFSHALIRAHSRALIRDQARAARAPVDKVVGYERVQSVNRNCSDVEFVLSVPQQRSALPRFVESEERDA